MAKIGSFEVQEGIVCASARIELSRWLAVKGGQLQAVFTVVRSAKRDALIAAQAHGAEVAAGKYEKGAELEQAEADAKLWTETLASATKSMQDIEAAVLAAGIKLQAARNEGSATPEMEGEYAVLAKDEGPIAAAYINARHAQARTAAVLAQATEARKQQAEQDAESALEAAQKGAQPVAEVSITIPYVRGEDVEAAAWAELLKQRPDIAAMDDAE